MLNRYNKNLVDYYNRQKLNSSNMHLTGEILEDKTHFIQLDKMYHSTFDLSKFVVTGTPTITVDGLASGFESTGTNIIKTQPLSLLNLKEKLTITSKFVYNTDKATSMVWCYNLNFFLSLGTERIQVAYRKLVEGVASTEYFQIPITLLNISQGDEVYIRTIFTENKVTLIINGETFEKNVDIDLTYIALPSVSFILGQANTNFATLYFQDTIDLKQFSITVDGVPVFNGNKTGIDIIKPDDYTVVGTPTISDDGIVYESSNDNYVQIPLIFADDFELEMSWTNKLKKHWWGYLIGGAFEIYHYNANGIFQVNLRHSGTFSTICNVQYIKGAKYKVRLKKTSDFLVVDIYINNELSVSETLDLSEIETLPTTTTLNVCNNNFGTKDPTMFYPVEVDLNNIKIWQYGSLYQPCLKIPYSQSKTGSKIVDAIYRDRVQDVFEQYGQADYYTIDEENKNFTLPMGEIYGMISNLQEEKTDIDLKNATIDSGLRRLIETSNPSVMPSWYKVYEEVNPLTGEKYYWCEQGGKVEGFNTVTFLKEYSQEPSIIAQVLTSESCVSVPISNITLTSFTIRNGTHGGQHEDRKNLNNYWEAKGYINRD